MELVSNAAEVAAVAAAIERAPLVAFDLEFVSQDRLVPKLCLIQVAWLDAARGEGVPQVRLVDPIVGDPTPVVNALAAHPNVIAHAPRQDLGLLATRFGVTMPGIIDTQLMAAFCGIGDQVGLSSLASDLLGLSLGKEMQWTDWAARPLSDAQLVYADADVRHLLTLYAKLEPRLGSRLDWVREESRAVGADAVAAASVTPETAWQNVGSLRGLDPAEKAAGIALAAWRLRVAVELDRPLGQVMTERVLVDLARRLPDAPGGVRTTKGLSDYARRRADDIVAAIGAAQADAAPPRTARQPISVRAQRWAEMLIAIVQIISEETGVAARLLATRADAEEFSRGFDAKGPEGVAHLPAFCSWRREVLGVAWHDWLIGRLSLVGDATAPHGVRLIPSAR